MSIFNHFTNMTLSNDQQKALEMIQDFLNSDESIFLLKGYAGTGKTTILKGIISYLNELNKGVQVMAPTGRAARILKKKTGWGTTIHQGIYDFEKLETQHIKNQETGEHTYKYFFPISKDGKDSHKIFIVDEASMISNRESKHELFQFGTGVLLQDLLTFSRVRETNNKIIFVGDPAQLPPVGDNQSMAFSIDFFKSLNLKVKEIEMKQVMRQTDNLILRNATKIRNIIKKPVKTELFFDYNDSDFIKLPNIEITSKYVDLFPIPELGQGVIVAFSNAQCLKYNQDIRSHIFAGKKEVTEGDILLICNNDYLRDLMNGDMVKVVEVSNQLIERKNIPVFEKGVKKPQNLTFRKVKIIREHSDVEQEFFIIDSLLNSSERDLSILEMKALFVDFVLRFREKHPNIAVGSEPFKNALKVDPFFNAMRVKYGYAITCHKSQGGEWDTVFVDYYGRVSLKEDPLRWCYTATTRASRRCFSINAPHFTALSQFTIGEIGKISAMPENALYLKNIPLSPFHSESQNRCKSLKYWEIQQKVKKLPYNLLDVRSFGDYQERYVFSVEEKEMSFDVFHNKAGIFKDFTPVLLGQNGKEIEVLEVLNKPYEKQRFDFNIDYQPSLGVLEKLYQLVQLACADCDVFITNVEEKPSNYTVTYFLKTSSKGAYIQFYFNGKEQLTRALPKSFDIDDEKLNQLIIKLKEYVV